MCVDVCECVREREREREREAAPVRFGRKMVRFENEIEADRAESLAGLGVLALMEHTL
jgi:hypothetical protein